MYRVIYRMIYFLPWILFSLTIIYLSHQERIDFLDNTIYLSDKLIHFVAYFFYGLSIQFALVNSNNYDRKKYFLLVILIGALFGASDEIHQYFIEGRSSEFLDWIADTLGVATSLLIKNVVLWIKNRVGLILNF
jgi:VanZ family protein